MSTARVDFTRGAAERIARAVRIVEQGERDQSGPTYPRIVEGGGGGGGVALKLGRITSAWDKSTLQDVVEYGEGEALSEEFAAPPVTITACVNKFANIESGAWVLIGRAHGRWYLVTAECEVPAPEEETPPA